MSEKDEQKLDYRTAGGELPRQLDPRKTLLRAVAILVMLAISVFGMLYVAWYLFTGQK
jgi:hypothetical protein